MKTIAAMPERCDRAAHGRRLAEAIHAPLAPGGLAIGRPGLAAGAPARLDHPGGVAAVLGATLALRAGPLRLGLVAARCSPGCGSARARASPRRRRAAPGRRARPRRRARGARRPPAAPPAAAPRGPRRCRRPARRRRARRASARSRAGPAAPASPPSRMARGDAPRVVCGRAAAPSSRLKATSGGRAATSTAPAVGCMRAGPKSGVRPSAHPLREARRPRRGAARRACARRPATP